MTGVEAAGQLRDRRSAGPDLDDEVALPRLVLPRAGLRQAVAKQFVPRHPASSMPCSQKPPAQRGGRSDHLRETAAITARELRLSWLMKGL